MLTPHESEILARWTDPQADEYSRLPINPRARTLYLEPAQLAHCLLLARITNSPLQLMCEQMAATLDDLKVHMRSNRGIRRDMIGAGEAGVRPGTTPVGHVTGWSDPGQLPRAGGSADER